jgi:hypothetical protein
MVFFYNFSFYRKYNSTQEEADTRIILHALYSDKLYQENNVQGRIVVKSPDTDNLISDL